MLPEQSCFTFQSMSQLQVPSLQKPWELQSSSIKQTYAREIKKKKIIQIDRKYCGCQQAAGYTKTQFLFYVVRILPTLPITYHK